jgi:hypothetical protein
LIIDISKTKIERKRPIVMLAPSPRKDLKRELETLKIKKIKVKIIKCMVNSFCIIVSPLDKFKKIIEIIVIIELIAN